jgi:hypothetical protein
MLTHPQLVMDTKRLFEDVPVKARRLDWENNDGTSSPN